MKLTPYVFNKLRLKYLGAALLSLPLLPFMYLDGLRIRSKVPKLPEAKHPRGTVLRTNNKAYQLLILGESTVAGVGVATHEEGYAGVLAAQLSELLNKTIHWEVFAKSGYTTKQVAEHILPTLPEKNYHLIVVGLGGNDAFTLNTPWHWRNHIDMLIVDLKLLFPNTPIYFANMPPIKEFVAFTPLIKLTIGNLVELLGDELKALVTHKDQVYYNDDVIRFKTWTERYKLDNPVQDFFSDGVHPSQLTYALWAKDSALFIHRQNILS